VFAATRERRDRSCVGRPPSLLIRGRCIRRSARSAPVGCCTEPHESPSKCRAPEPARARGVTSPGWHAPNECLHLRGAADYAGKYQGLEEHAQAGRRRGFPMARSAAHVCELPPAGGYRDLRAATAGRLEDAVDGGALCTPSSRGLADSGQQTGRRHWPLSVVWIKCGLWAAFIRPERHGTREKTNGRQVLARNPESGLSGAAQVIRHGPVQLTLELTW
jgi:hypothetical protein